MRCTIPNGGHRLDTGIHPRASVALDLQVWDILPAAVAAMRPLHGRAAVKCSGHCLVLEAPLLRQECAHPGLLSILQVWETLPTAVSAIEPSHAMSSLSSTIHASLSQAQSVADSAGSGDPGTRPSMPAVRWHNQLQPGPNNPSRR